MSSVKTFFKSTHGQMAYTTSAGGKIPVIFMHGLPTSKEIWNPVIPFLSSQITPITYDLLDYGESEKINRAISHMERADALDEFRSHLGLKTFILVAHDLGSSVAIDYMGKYASRVDKLVLMSPPVYPDFKEPFLVKLVRIQGLGEFLIRFLKGILLRIGILQGMSYKDRFTDPIYQAISNGFAGKEGNRALLRALRWGRPFNVFKDYPRIIKSIRVPTLILHGKQDPYIPLVQSTRLRDDLPNSRLTILPQGSHFLPMDAPQEVANEINSFILNEKASLTGCLFV